MSRICRIPSRDRNDVDPVAEILRRQRIPACEQHLLTSTLQEINGKKKLGGRQGGGDGEKKAKESEEFEEQNCLYIQDGDYRAKF